MILYVFSLHQQLGLIIGTCFFSPSFSFIFPAKHFHNILVCSLSGTCLLRCVMDRELGLGETRTLWYGGGKWPVNPEHWDHSLRVCHGWRGLQALKLRFLHPVLRSREHCLLLFIVQMSHGSVILLGKYLCRAGNALWSFQTLVSLRLRRALPPGERETRQIWRSRRDVCLCFTFWKHPIPTPTVLPLFDDSLNQRGKGAFQVVVRARLANTTQCLCFPPPASFIFAVMQSPSLFISPSRRVPMQY